MWRADKGTPPTAELRAQGCSRNPSSLRAIREQDPFTSWMEEVLARAGLSLLLTQEVPQSCPPTPTMHNAIVFWTLSLSDDMFLDSSDGGHPRPALWQGTLSLSPAPSRAAVNICVACMPHNSRGIIQNTLWAMSQALCSASCPATRDRSISLLLPGEGAESILGAPGLAAVQGRED